MKNARRNLIFAAVALTVGLWLLFDALGYEVWPFRRLWPVFLLLGGLVSLAHYAFLGRRPRSLGQGVLGIGLAALLFPFTFGHALPREILDWLPGLPLVIGLALLATWAAAGRRPGHRLVAGVVLVVLGVVGFAARFEWLARILPSAQIVWAVALVVLGLFLVWNTFRRR